MIRSRTMKSPTGAITAIAFRSLEAHQTLVTVSSLFTLDLMRPSVVVPVGIGEEEASTESEHDHEDDESQSLESFRMAHEYSDSESHSFI